MAGKRNNAVDIARGIAMFSIVLGHLGVFSINRVVFTYEHSGRDVCTFIYVYRPYPT